MLAFWRQLREKGTEAVFVFCQGGEEWTDCWIWDGSRWYYYNAARKIATGGCKSNEMCTEKKRARLWCLVSLCQKSECGRKGEGKCSGGSNAPDKEGSWDAPTLRSGPRWGWDG